MATIAISDLHPAGFEFFLDSETFLTDLSSDEVEDISGGGSPLLMLGFIARSSVNCGEAIGVSVSVVGTAIYTVTRR